MAIVSSYLSVVTSNGLKYWIITYYCKGLTSWIERHRLGEWITKIGSSYLMCIRDSLWF